jgi:hypothetical protein
MKTAPQYVRATASILSIQMTAMPTITTMTTTSPDPWECIAANLSQYFDVPMPTGSLLTAVYSYGRELAKACSFTGIDETKCPKPETTKWCDLSTAAPQTLIPEHKSYGSVASSWWFGHSISIMMYSTMCPRAWSCVGPSGLYTWLNITNGIGECYATAYPTEGVPDKEKGPVTSSTGSGSSPKPAKTNGAGRQSERAEGLIAVAAIVIGAINW